MRRELDVAIIKKFRLGRHMQFGEYKEFSRIKNNQYAVARIWIPCKRIKKIIDFMNHERILNDSKIADNYNVKLFYRKHTAFKVFTKDPFLYMEIQGIPADGETAKEIIAYHTLLRLQRKIVYQPPK